MSALKFGRGKFNVLVNGYNTEVEGQVCDDFGIFKAGFLKWRIVHLHTGRAIHALDGVNAKTVKARVEALYEVCNWNHFSIEDITKAAGKTEEDLYAEVQKVEQITVGG